MQLAAKADVIVENYRSDVKYRLKVDYDTVAKVNPRIVYGSISGFGQTGPDATRPGVDQIAQGMGGLMSITGLPGQGPVRVGIPIADLTSGMFLSQAILLALMQRAQTGEGQWVHTSLLEAQIFMLDFQASRWLIAHEVPGQAGNDHPTGIPTGVFPTADGHINIAASGQVLWTRFCKAIGWEEALADPDYATGALRSKNRKALNERLGAITRTQTERALAGGAEQGRRAVRADQRHRGRVRRAADAASGHRAAGASSEAGRHQRGRPADQHERRPAAGGAAPDAGAGRSTPTRSWPGWAMTRRRSPDCARTARSERRRRADHRPDAHARGRHDDVLPARAAYPIRRLIAAARASTFCARCTTGTSIIAPSNCTAPSPCAKAAS